VPVYLGLGSNLGDREQVLRAAIARLAESGFRNLRQSSLYQTEPMGFADQPWFLNMVVEADTSLSPRAVLRHVRGIERDLGRKRTFKNGPRVIDIDLLLQGETILKAPHLIVPHPRMCERRFVLDPLVELAPDLRHPISGLLFTEELSRLSGQEIRKLGPLV
jgi:2-amino-4-hydroxy-6-hydroxymethyldihydropteridine diphosphokinase